MTAYVLAAALAAAGLWASHLFEAQLAPAPATRPAPYVNAFGEVVYA